MTTARIVVVSRTKMSNGNICVGAFDVDNQRNIRLLDALGHPQSANFPLQIGNVAMVTYRNKVGAVAPHTEDVILQSHAPCPNEAGVRKIFSDAAPVVKGPITNCFDGKLCKPAGKALAISKDDTSNHSVCFWASDEALNLNGFGKYDYRSGLFRTNISYVGIPDAIPVIPKGTVIRLSLSRWWSVPGSDEKHCWLQLSGWY